MIYFARIAQDGPVKIGHTDNLAQRMIDLACYYKSRPVILCTMKGDRETERQLHHRFRHYRIDTTEQFRPGPDLMHFIGHPEAEDWQSVGRAKQADFLHIRMTRKELELLDELVEFYGAETRTRLIRIMIRDAYKQMIAGRKSLGIPDGPPLTL